MSDGIDSFKLSNSLSEIQNRLEDLRTRCISNLGNVDEILSDALEQLQSTLEELSAADESLWQSEAELRLVTDNVPLLLAHVSSDLRYIFVNQSYADWFHLKRSEIIGRHISEVLSKEGYEATLDSIKKALTGEKADYKVVVQKEGRPRVMHIAFIPHLDEHRMMQSYYTVTQDITERKRAEDALRQSQSMLARAEKIANIGSWEWYIRSGELIWSEQVYRMFGLVPGQFVPTYESFLAYVHPDFRQLVAQAVESALSGEKLYDIEYQIVTSSSITCWAHSKGEVVFDEIGQPISMVGTVLDITERKLMEIALQESKEKFRLVADFTYDWETWLDLKGNYNFVSPSCERITGHHAEEFIKDPQLAIDLVHPDDKEAFKDHRNIHFKGQTSSGQIDYRIVTKNGETRWISHLCQPVFGRNGEWLGRRASNRDITERKQAEEELRKAKDELELRVQERTAELVKAKEAAEAASKTKAEFLANMSHEIRTPMNSIIGFTELLLDGDEPLSPEQKDNLETIRTNGDALLSIINDILEFSKMESDKVVLEEQHFNLRSCVEEAIALVAIKASEKGLNLAYVMDKSVPDTIIGDPTRLRQILGNLLSNAVKFTDGGEVVLSVSSQEFDGINETNEVHFAVRDTGIGIPEDNIDQLFQSFSQMEPSTTRLYGGTGLGLAISKKLVEMMGGRIWAKSKVGEGSMFHFTIKASSGQFEPKPAAVSPQLIGKCVLIVEDNKTNRRILSKQVYDWGMIPLAATSGQEALKYIQRGDDFDIAILDMDMQDMSSLGLEEGIRKYNKALPLVWLASLGKRIPPNHAYLTKPIKPSQLHKVLTEILSMQSDKRPVKASGVNRSVRNSPLRILLAEDNVSSQKVALQMLHKLGYKADAVANGLEALHAMERQHYDIILMDIKMPEMDGLEATKIIRQRWPDGPKIIAITAYGLDGDREKFIEAGMDDYISKPVKKEDLAKVLEKYGVNTTLF